MAVMRIGEYVISSGHSAVVALPICHAPSWYMPDADAAAMKVIKLRSENGDFMRVGMVTYFDLGYSCGLSDRVLRPERCRSEAAIGLVGIRNPLGQGISVDLLDHPKNVLPLWRKLAAHQIDRPEMELG